MFGLAVQWEMRPDNPCRGVARNREVGRERYLSPAELTRLMAALAADKRQDRANLIRLLLLTGCRRGEMLQATWDEFDLDAGVWTKPASRTKQGRSHRIPLSAPARLILGEMRAAADSPMLFPARRRNSVQVNLNGFWRQVCVAAGIEGVRMHDLRHAYASFLASGGLSLPIIGALLGHSQPSTTNRYSHLLDDPLRQATEKVGQIIENAAPAKRAL
jgi:integrase